MARDVLVKAVVKSRKRFCHSSQIRSRHVYHLCSAGHALRDLLQPAPRDQTTDVLTVGGKYRCKSRVGRLERERKRDLESSTVPSRSSPGETDDTGNFESTSWQQLSSLVHLVSITRRAKLHRRAPIVLHYMLQVCCFPLLLDLAPRHPSFPSRPCTALLESQPDHHHSHSGCES